MVTRCREWAAAAAVLGAVLGLALAPGGAARAEILAAELQVNGMACPFCAFGIEKKLLDVEGVERVDIRLDAGLLVLALAPGNPATTAALEAAVGKAGFELGGLTVEVRGTLEAAEGQTWLDAQNGERFVLLEPADGGARPLSPATRERLAVDGGGRVRVRGRVQGGGGAPRLVVDPAWRPGGEAP